MTYLYEEDRSISQYHVAVKVKELCYKIFEIFTMGRGERP